MALEELKMTFTDVIEAICKRPEMYTMNGSFAEVLAHLEGYANGKRLGFKGRSSSYFHGFGDWVGSQMGVPKHPRFWRYFAGQFPDDATAAREFARLWRIYRESHPDPPDTPLTI